MNEAQRQFLVTLADRYETASFIEGDPSWFMHQVSDPFDQETSKRSIFRLDTNLNI